MKSASNFALAEVPPATNQAANSDGSEALVARLKEELDDLEPVVSAAVLVVGAFRLRDEEGLVATLRGLSEAMSVLESRRPPG